MVSRVLKDFFVGSLVIFAHLGSITGCKYMGTRQSSSTHSLVPVSEKTNTFRVENHSQYFKKFQLYEGELSSDDRCLMMDGDLITYQGELGFENNHLILTLADESLPQCVFRKGYIEGDQYAALVKKPEPTPTPADSQTQQGGGSTGDGNNGEERLQGSSLFRDYNALVGDELAGSIHKRAYCSVTGGVVACGSEGRSRGCCYSCVAGPDSRYPGALSRRLSSLGGRAIWPVGTAPELNTRSYAKSFAEYFVPARHESMTRLRAAYLKGKVDKVGGVEARYKLPRGSVIVWRSCSLNPAGHIAIVTQEGKQACSDFCSDLDQCPASNIIGMFYPF